jgi:gliding motility-associated-like protein
VDQPYCFNNGSFDADGDSLSYTLIAPYTSATTTVTYIAPYSALQPLASSPAVTFNNATGDMCMTPTMLQVTVFAVKVEEWRAGELVGSVMRDIQMRTITCTNNNPYVNGINNTGTYSLNGCAGAPINFSIETFDADASQNVSISWNAGISGATFNPGTGSRPTAMFSWTPTAADISTATHCFTVTVQDDNCPYNGSQTYSFCISVSGLTLTTTTSDANCGASNGSAEVTVTAGTGPFIYQWIGGGSDATQNGLAAGTYTVNVTSSGGCTSSATAVIGSGAAHGNINIAAVNVSCYGAADATATVNVSGGMAPYTYLWSNGAITETVGPLAPGSYTVQITTANGCVSSDSIVITQPAAPLSVGISSSPVTCFGSADGSLLAAVSGGTTPYDFNWTGLPPGTGSSATSLTAGTYTLTLTDDNGCTVTQSAVVASPAALSANAMVVSHVSCFGLSDGSATVGASGGSGTFSYQWNTAPAQTVQTATGLDNGNYTVTVTDANGCTATSSITVNEPAALTMSAAAFPVSCYGSCNGQTVVIPAGGTPTYSYQWLPTGGTSASATGLCAGTYTVIVNDANGCEINTTLAVTQPAPLTLTASGSTTICLGQNTVISANASGGTASYSYSWAGLGAGANQTVSPSSPTLYSVTAIDANGCVSPAATVAIDVTSLTASNVSVSPATAICFGQTTSVSSSVSGSTGPVTVAWSGGLGTGNGPFTISPATTTTYTVTVTDACGNSVNATVPVTVNPLPVVELQNQTAAACEEVHLNFTDNTAANAGATYNWNFGDGTYSSQPNPVHTYSSTGTYNVMLTMTSVHGCVATASATNNVVVYPASIAAFTAEGLDGSTISPQYLFHNSSVNSASYFWTFGDGNNSTATDPLHVYALKGEYTVTLFTESADGCRDSLSRVVEIRPEFTIYIPNAFTPDANGTNDFFTAKGDEITEFTMLIFDRWGELIYETSDMSRGWDGTARSGGSVVQNGVYVYKISVRDFEHRYHDFTGHVTLLASE